MHGIFETQLGMCLPGALEIRPIEFGQPLTPVWDLD